MRDPRWLSRISRIECRWVSPDETGGRVHPWAYGGRRCSRFVLASGVLHTQPAGGIARAGLSSSGGRRPASVLTNGEPVFDGARRRRCVADLAPPRPPDPVAGRWRRATGAFGTVDRRVVGRDAREAADDIDGPHQKRRRVA